jgi:uncharacterized Zn finger protein
MTPETHPEIESLSNVDQWRGLTWDDLEEWVGPRSLQRGRSYQRTGRVQDLARAADGALIAWVRGTERYATLVQRIEADGQCTLRSRCTCPLGNACKHAVAVVVDYLEALKKQRHVPTADALDPRQGLLSAESAPSMGNRGPGKEPEAGRPLPHRDRVRAYLEGLPAADLVQYLLDVAQRHPDVARELKARSALARGEADEVVRQARDLIRQLTHEPAWYNPWTGEGSLPDYSGLRVLFDRLLETGQADALLGLGETLFDAGTQQIGASRDEGETGGQIAGCLDVVFRAVLAANRTDAEKLQYTIDLLLRDDYKLCRGADAVLERAWPEFAWSAVADELARRLNDLPPPAEDFSERYGRKRLSNWLARALRHSGRRDEVLALLETEAPLTASYDRLVDALSEAGRIDEARRWAREGIERTTAKWPGIALRLRERLRELSEREADWPTVAAMRAEEFFADPSVHALRTLDEAAERAGCGPAVHAAALQFLESGIPPAPAPAKGKTQARRSAATWPLPAVLPELRGREGPGRAGPYFDVLLELALDEKRPDDVLQWYDRWRAGRAAGPFRGHSGGIEGRIADAVADTHPDRAAALYRDIIAGHIVQTSPTAYKAAMPYLRKLRALLYRARRDEEWRHYLAHLRETERRKRRLMEVLDRVERRPIVEG